MKKLSLICGVFIFFGMIFSKKISAQSIGAGYLHTLFLCSDSTVKATGQDFYGQLGDGIPGTSGAFVSVANLNKVKAVFGGVDQSYALRYDSTLWAWGNNNVGQLGDGTTMQKFSPVQIATLGKIVAVYTHHEQALVLKADGTVWGIGAGYLGDSISNFISTPRQISNLTNVVSIALLPPYGFAVKADGTVWGWGDNSSGLLGVTSNTIQYLPIQIPNITNAISVAIGYTHVLVLKSDGTVWAWGDNTYGQLGIGNTINQTIPIQIPGLSNIINIRSVTGGPSNFALKNDGTIWTWGSNQNGLFGTGNYISSSSPIQLNNLYNIVELNSHSKSVFALKGDGTIWAWGENTYGQLLGLGSPTTTVISPTKLVGSCPPLMPQHHYDHYVKGFIYGDDNHDCAKTATEPKFNLPLIASPGNLYSSSNDTGFYSIGVYNSFSYTLQPIIPQRFSGLITNSCPINYNVNLNAIHPVDTTGFDFGLDYSPCPLLRVDIASDRRRRCYRNNTKVYYTNEGFAPANNVQIRVKYDKYITPLSSDFAYSYGADSSLTFIIGTILAGQKGVIHIVDSVACINGIKGLTQCTKAWIIPANQCLIDSTTGPGWDGSEIKVKGFCLNDTVRFIIKNNGAGNMATSNPFRIYFDNVLIQTSNFQLNAGDSLRMNIISNGATIRLEADQNLQHSANSHPRETVEACGTNSIGGFSINQVNQAPMDDEGIDVEIDCMPIRDSYDPNLKENSPEGIGSSHIILPNTLLDYVIHFQNTGSDTAYKVVVVDTLSTDFNMASIELGASSHPYSFSISGEAKAILKFTFNNIDLSDSTSNEPLSRGFVKFKIEPKAGTPLGTVIKNSVDIYFDYNPPIKTNSAFVTIGNYASIETSLYENNNSTQEDIVYSPNPTNGLVIGYFKTVSKEKTYIEITNLMGQTVLNESTNNQQIIFNLQGFTNGVYIIKTSNKEKTVVKKIVLQN
ncbi:MAG: T9SS type A sorting domain-containing protein [Bacteroidia bacterium]|nr:T9SS type A sorting domain-containing protein [Bacteroidia bacterium]